MELTFETEPSRYRHWKLAFAGDTATLTMAIELHGGLKPDYELKLNSYDLSVDIELADALQRIRFEHPETKVVVVSSGIDRVFCSGANIYMLGSSTHAFKVNFCKFTNETRLYLEDASAHSGIKFLAALNGACAGGGYELALACDDILLIDDGSSAVSLPEVPLLGVLPGTGGLTRVVDKRKVRRDRADVFCTTSEGLRGKRAVEWGLVDAIASRSKFDEAVKERAEVVRKRADASGVDRPAKGIALAPLAPTVTAEAIDYKHVSLRIDTASRRATLTVRAPETAAPSTPEALVAAGSDLWSLRAFRELDDALLRLRFSHPQVGLLVLETSGNAEHVLSHDNALFEHKNFWFAREVLLLQARVLRRLDLSARSLFALAGEGSCFAGSLLELALAADRFYMLSDDDGAVAVQTSALSGGALPMSHGLSRLEDRFYGDAARAKAVAETRKPLGAEEADELGIPTFTPDEIDWEDDIRIALEERASISPDALSGMEASLRFVGPETLESKIFARLSAWQNWIFQRPNAVGPNGALTKYGQPDRPVFDWTRC
jgi:benzoyl-CoA-dihydrodiol lyase